MKNRRWLTCENGLIIHPHETAFDSIASLFVMKTENLIAREKFKKPGAQIVQYPDRWDAENTGFTSVLIGNFFQIAILLKFL